MGEVARVRGRRLEVLVGDPLGAGDFFAESGFSMGRGFAATVVLIVGFRKVPLLPCGACDGCARVLVTSKSAPNTRFGVRAWLAGADFRAPLSFVPSAALTRLVGDAKSDRELRFWFSSEASERLVAVAVKVATFQL